MQKIRAQTAGCAQRQEQALRLKKEVNRQCEHFLIPDAAFEKWPESNFLPLASLGETVTTFGRR